MEHIYDIAIIGGGPGGYTAAMYAARAGLDVVVLERLSAGGQMALTSQIDNYPGFPDGVDGFMLGLQMQQGAEQFGAKTKLVEVQSVDLSSEPKRIDTSEGQLWARAVIIATGANPRPLGLPDEQELVGRGVHYCAHCDGMFYRGKTVAVVGGGNSAAADAMYLSRMANKVILVHRRDALRATKIYHEPLEQAENVEFLWNSTVSGLLSGEKLTGLMVEDLNTGEQRQIDCDGLFISIGRAPATELVIGQLPLDDKGYIVADETTATAILGVFAVGDVRAKKLRQIVTAVADGAIAAHSAEEYLMK